jgi:hypothetical protein
MATVYKTPGVYIEEIPKLPPSVAQVETAIPAFIGYTEKAEKNGENVIGIPTRISSLVEYESYFGKGYGFVPGDIKILLEEANNFAVKSVKYNTKVFFMYDAIRQFYDNGGGNCYIVAADTYSGAGFTNGEISDVTDLSKGLTALEKYDEPTIIVIPDAVNLNETMFYPLQQAAIAQSAKLQDRFAVLDLKENLSTWETAKENFRNSIGISNLKYAAAYTPWLFTTYATTVDFRLLNQAGAVRNADDTANIDLLNLTTNTTMNNLVIAAQNSTDDLNVVKGDIDTLRATFKTIADRYSKLRSDVMLASNANTAAAFEALVVFVRDIVNTFPDWRKDASTTKFKNANLITTLDTIAKDNNKGLRKFVKDFIAFEKNTAVDALVGGTIPDYAPGYEDMPAADAESWLGVNDIDDIAPAAAFGPTGTDTERRSTVLIALPVLDAIFNGLDSFVLQVLDAVETYKTLSQNALYAGHTVFSSIVNAVKKHLSKLPPSGSIAGIYARVDNARGVWKAPANESINSVLGPSEQITADQQSGLNVDPVAGKSINVIRAFTGKGTLVWGARTLSGNDNEWRYVNVRRFFNMVEESSKKATEPFVFEPNDANTWVKVQGMLENFLTVLWRQGALQGAKPEHAFYVAVGLGKTMTALDILEGRMIVEIGMAVVRPAEFIILRFSHKMAES